MLWTTWCTCTIARGIRYCERHGVLFYEAFGSVSETWCTILLGIRCCGRPGALLHKVFGAVGDLMHYCTRHSVLWAT